MGFLAKLCLSGVSLSVPFERGLASPFSIPFRLFKIDVSWGVFAALIRKKVQFFMRFLKNDCDVFFGKLCDSVQSVIPHRGVFFIHVKALQLNLEAEIQTRPWSCGLGAVVRVQYRGGAHERVA